MVRRGRGVSHMLHGPRTQRNVHEKKEKKIRMLPALLTWTTPHRVSLQPVVPRREGVVFLLEVFHGSWLHTPTRTHALSHLQ